MAKKKSGMKNFLKTIFHIGSHNACDDYIREVKTVGNSRLVVDSIDGGICTLKTTDNAYVKVLQLTDLHIGGSFVSESADLAAFKAMTKLIEYSKPDLIVITGDLTFAKWGKAKSNNNLRPFIQLCEFFERIGVIWCFTFGNHDTEMQMKYKGSDFIESAKRYKKCLLPEKNECGKRLNMLVNIKDMQGKIFQSLFLLDSGDYAHGGYDCVGEEQLDWYEACVNDLKSQGVESSMMFFHVPMLEWKDIVSKYNAHSPEITYYYGRMGERGGAVCASEKGNSILERINRLENTKAVFVGHDHLNDLSVEYKGVRYTYGKSIDYLAYDGIEESTFQRGATLITLHTDSEFEITPIVLCDIAE